MALHSNKLLAYCASHQPLMTRARCLSELVLMNGNLGRVCLAVQYLVDYFGTPLPMEVVGIRERVLREVMDEAARQYAHLDLAALAAFRAALAGTFTSE